MEMTDGKVCDKKNSVLIWLIIFVFAYTLSPQTYYTIFLGRNDLLLFLHNSFERTLMISERKLRYALKGSVVWWRYTQRHGSPVHTELQAQCSFTEITITL